MYGDQSQFKYKTFLVLNFILISFFSVFAYSVDPDLKTLEADVGDTCDIEREDEGRVVCKT